MHDNEFEKVIKSQLFTSATPETLRIVGEFSILYSIFERRFFYRSYKLKSGEMKYDVKFNTDEKKITKMIAVDDTEAPYQHFRKRYWLDKEEGPLRFKNLDISGSLKNRIWNLIQGAASDEEKRYTVIIMMNALRNNLFHGVKGTDSFNENRENFVVLNSFLLDILSNARASYPAPKP